MPREHVDSREWRQWLSQREQLEQLVRTSPGPVTIGAAAERLRIPVRRCRLLADESELVSVGVALMTYGGGVSKIGRVSDYVLEAM